MAVDWSKMSDEELIANSPSMIQPAQSSDVGNPRLTTVQPSQDNVVLTDSGASGVKFLPGQIAEKNAMNQADIDKQRALIPIEVESASEKKKAELQQARKAFQSGLKTFLFYDKMIPRGHDLIGRHLEGLDSMWQGVNQSSERGTAVAMHNNMIKGLKTPLVKILGDTGALSVSDLKAAEQLFTKLSDSQDVTDAKQAFLVQLATGVENNDIGMVRDVIKNFMGSKFYDGEKDKESNRHSSSTMDDLFGADEDIMQAKF